MALRWRTPRRRGGGPALRPAVGDVPRPLECGSPVDGLVQRPTRIRVDDSWAEMV